MKYIVAKNHNVLVGGRKKASRMLRSGEDASCLSPEQLKHLIASGDVVPAGAPEPESEAPSAPAPVGSKAPEAGLPKGAGKTIAQLAEIEQGRKAAGKPVAPAQKPPVVDEDEDEDDDENDGDDQDEESGEDAEG